jgi:hypothetical protein
LRNLTGRVLRDAFTQEMPLTCGCARKGFLVPQLRLPGKVSDRTGKRLRDQA